MKENLNERNLYRLNVLIYSLFLTFDILLHFYTCFYIFASVHVDAYFRIFTFVKYITAFSQVVSI